MAFVPTFASHPHLEGWAQPSWSAQQPPSGMPWPPLDPGINPAHLLHLEHAVLGLPSSIPTCLNATMLPFAGGYLPPVMQAALPPVDGPLHPQAVIGFLAALNQQSITDVMVVRGDDGARGSPLLQQLSRPGQSVTCSVPGTDGRPVTATVYRTDVPCEDGSWLMQVDLSHGARMMSSQLLRVHESDARPDRPAAFLDGVSRGFDSWHQGLARGEDRRMAVLCDDGARRSGAAISLMHQMQLRQMMATLGQGGAMLTPQSRQSTHQRFDSECRELRGEAFGQGQERLIQAAFRQMAESPRAAGGATVPTAVPTDHRLVDASIPPVGAGVEQMAAPPRATGFATVPTAVSINQDPLDWPIPPEEVARLPPPLQPSRPAMPSQGAEPTPVARRAPIHDSAPASKPADVPTPKEPVTPRAVETRLAPKAASTEDLRTPSANRIPRDPTPVRSESAPDVRRHRPTPNGAPPTDRALDRKLPKVGHFAPPGMSLSEMDDRTFSNVIEGRLRKLRDQPAPGTITDKMLQDRLAALKGKASTGSGLRRAGSEPALPTSASAAAASPATERALAAARDKALSNALVRKPTPPALAHETPKLAAQLSKGMQAAIHTMLRPDQSKPSVLDRVRGQSRPPLFTDRLAALGPAVSQLRAEHAAAVKQGGAKSTDEQAFVMDRLQHHARLAMDKLSLADRKALRILMVARNGPMVAADNARNALLRGVSEPDLRSARGLAEHATITKRYDVLDLTLEAVREAGRSLPALR